jgi:hypothetical protein
VGRHPWLAVTIAAAAGFVLPDIIGRSQYQTPQTPTAGASPPPAGSTPGAAQVSPPPPASSLRAAISREILAVMRPVLIAAITQHLKSTVLGDEPSKPSNPPSHTPPAA